MTYDDLIAHFGRPIDAANALGVDRRLVDMWKKRRIPSKYQLRVEFVSEGKCKADKEARAEGKEIASYVNRAAA